MAREKELLDALRAVRQDGKGEQWLHLTNVLMNSPIFLAGMSDSDGDLVPVTYEDQTGATYVYAFTSKKRATEVDPPGMTEVSRDIARDIFPSTARLGHGVVINPTTDTAVRIPPNMMEGFAAAAEYHSRLAED